eukprot:471533_1
MDHQWFKDTKIAYDSLNEFIDKYFKKEMAVITRLSISGLYHGMNYLAKNIIDAGFYFNPFKFGEAIVELLFSKLRSSGKAVAKDYATGIAQQNASLHRKRVAFNNKNK